MSTPPAPPQPPPQPTTTIPLQNPQPTLPIRTLHCTFCSHLLLASTRVLSTLPRRTQPGTDNALILPLEKLRTSTTTPAKSSASPQGQHVTLLLSTTIPDKRATLIRREDGIEKRILLRCGRCRVVVGYYLDRIHWDGENRVVGERAGEDEEGEEDGVEERFPAMYVLPGALTETEGLGGKVEEEEWRRWVGDS